MSSSVGAGKVDMVQMLLEAGADPDAAFMEAYSSGDAKMIRAVLASAKVKPETLGAALFFTPASKTEITKALTEAGAKPLPPASADPVPHPSPFAKTKLTALFWCSHHEMLHAGQIGLLRRQLGHPPL
jgi:uncharacterized damage-inducible protein DinB